MPMKKGTSSKKLIPKVKVGAIGEGQGKPGKGGRMAPPMHPKDKQNPDVKGFPNIPDFDKNERLQPKSHSK